MRNLIQRALRQADDLVVVFDYRDSKGVLNRRVVSPVRFLAGDRFLALCLSREEPRQFYLNRCENMRIDWAINFVMPVPMVQVDPVPALATSGTAASVTQPQAAA